MSEETKRCSKCGEVKPVREFHRNVGRLRSECKRCISVKKMQYYADNRSILINKSRIAYYKNRFEILYRAAIKRDAKKNRTQNSKPSPLFKLSLAHVEIFSGN